MLLIKHAKEVYLVVEQVLREMIPEMGVYRLCIDETNSSPIKILKCSDLVDHLPLTAYAVDGFWLMPLKHSILDLA